MKTTGFFIAPVLRAFVNGEEALAMTRRETVDLILLDTLLPKFHGPGVMRTLTAEEKSRAISAPILSNSSRKQDVQEGMQWGAVGYLVKANLSLQELGNRVAQLLGA